MRAIPGYLNLTASQRRLLLSVPVKDLHNVVIKAAGACWIGGEDIQANFGLGLEAGDIAAWNWQDFRADETGEFKLYGIASADTTISYLIWRR